jgi:hypothetical protein
MASWLHTLALSRVTLATGGWLSRAFESLSAPAASRRQSADGQQ